MKSVYRDNNNPLLIIVIARVTLHLVPDSVPQVSSHSLVKSNVNMLVFLSANLEVNKNKS